MSSERSPGRHPLSGVRVLEVAQGICGPYTGKLLADAGAEVVKIEPAGGDAARGWRAVPESVPGGGDGAFFQFLNASKRSVTLDPAEPAGREALHRLAANADLVIESRGMAGCEASGVDAAALRAATPGLSVLSISPFGSGGPASDLPANEFTLQSWVGSTYTRGLPDQEPVAVGGRLGEFLAAAFAASACLAAIRSCDQSGVGQHVDFSIHEAMMLGFQQYRFIFEAFEPSFTVSREVEIPSIEPAKDGFVGFATITAQQFADFCVLIEQPELGQDASLATFQGRMAERERVWASIRGYTRRHTVDDLLERALLFRTPSAPVLDGSQVAALPHFVERGVFVESPGGFTQPRVPYRLSRCESRPFEPAPALGADGEALAGEPLREGTRPPGGPAGPPLAGLRVLDLTAFLAGPIASTQLGGFGADVIKLESIQRPDLMRFSSGFVRDELWEWSPIYHGANAGKRGITLDLDSEAGRGLLEQLVTKCDFLVENFSPRVLENFGLSWDRLHALNPRLIVVRMPAFGLDGPWRERTGFATTIEMVSGLAWRTGHPDQTPLVPRGPCDPLGGMHAVFAALLALRHRDATGEGQLVEVPLVEAGLNAAAEQVIEWSAYGERVTREGNRCALAAPQGMYAARGHDQWVALSVEGDAAWAGLRTVLGDPGWAAGAALGTLRGRIAAHDEIDAPLRAWFAEQERDDVVARLLDAGVPAAPVISPVETGRTPQLRARGFFQEIQHPLTGATPYPSFPARFDGRYPAFSGPSPTLGQHTEEVLRELLGVTDDELAALREQKVIGTRPAFV